MSHKLELEWWKKMKYEERTLELAEEAYYYGFDVECDADRKELMFTSTCMHCDKDFTSKQIQPYCDKHMKLAYKKQQPKQKFDEAIITCPVCNGVGEIVSYKAGKKHVEQCSYCEGEGSVRQIVYHAVIK